MRRKSEAVLGFESRDDASLPKVVLREREKYRGISRVLDETPGDPRPPSMRTC